MLMRKIVQYLPATKGYIAVLECGHTHHLYHHSPTSRVLCWDCKEAAPGEKGRPMSNYPYIAWLEGSYESRASFATGPTLEAAKEVAYARLPEIWANTMKIRPSNPPLRVVITEGPKQQTVLVFLYPAPLVAEEGRTP